MVRLKRVVRLIVDDESGYPLIDNNQLRVDFNIEKAIGGAMDTGRITIYNLSNATISKLSAGGHKRVRIRVSSITNPEESDVFDGRLINIHHSVSFQDSITTLWCWDKLSDIGRNPVKDMPSMKNTTIGGVISAILNDMNKGGEVFISDWSRDLGGLVNATPVPTFSFGGTYLDCIRKVMNKAGATFSFDDDILLLSPQPHKDGEVESWVEDNRHAEDINPMLIKKPIELSIAAVDISYELAVNLKPVDLVRILSNEEFKKRYGSGTGPLQTSLSIGSGALSVIEEVKDLVPVSSYFISKITHSGSAYTDAWDTNIHGVIFKGGISN